MDLYWARGSGAHINFLESFSQLMGGHTYDCVHLGIEITPASESLDGERVLGDLASLGVGQNDAVACHCQRYSSTCLHLHLFATLYLPQDAPVGRGGLRLRVVCLWAYAVGLLVLVCRLRLGLRGAGGRPDFCRGRCRACCASSCNLPRGMVCALGTGRQYSAYVRYTLSRPLADDA